MRNITSGVIGLALILGISHAALADEPGNPSGPGENGVWELNANGNADPVSSAQLYSEMRIQGGQYASNYRHQMLTGDFTCDDVVDRVAGWVDLDSPDGPKFAMLFVTNHGGKAQSEIRYLPFEQSEQYALCIHDETAPPVMSWQENSQEFMEEVIGSKDMCNFAIRVDDFMCDAPQFFYSEKPANNGDHWFFFRN
ncbi:hypothetical protein [Thalassospira povalilytica]|uniref:hypothetical protein n=1 Tax=Thalassospira povalilytica TaxID=732237 RepID=UPI001D190379|nr:hypothetical protein [Thalassospira povalilytica]MCC4239063.1 hypothetical protein [Thalassospira povalilytica]